ncbi:MAG TPA: SMP-30/gluconolactonase/LRE family protein [Vicinamibacterales bacterium]
MKQTISAALLTAVLVAGASAQQLSSLGSLFDRYTVSPTWAQLPPTMPWGASTSSVAVDGQGRVIALVRAVPYFRMFNADGSFVRAWGDAGLFHLAHSVHVAPDGAIWATDPDDHLVHKFGPDGKVVLTIGKKGVGGNDASTDAFNQPNSVGFGPNGDVFVSDGYVNSRVVQFTAEGRLVRIFGGKKGAGPGELNTPHGVAIDPQGRVVVADSGNKRLAIFGPDGAFLKNIAAPSRGGVAASPDGTLYVSDVNAGAVTVLKGDQIVDVIKVDGRPHGLAVDVRTGDVYTSSTLADRWNVTKTVVKKAAPR